MPLKQHKDQSKRSSFLHCRRSRCCCRRVHPSLKVQNQSNVARAPLPAPASPPLQVCPLPRPAAVALHTLPPAAHASLSHFCQCQCFPLRVQYLSTEPYTQLSLLRIRLGTLQKLQSVDRGRVVLQLSRPRSIHSRNVSRLRREQTDSQAFGPETCWYTSRGR